MCFMKIKWSDVIESSSEKEYLKIRWSGKAFKKKYNNWTENWIMKKRSNLFENLEKWFPGRYKDDEIDVSLASCEDQRKIFVAKM